jgi:hypothetical protein
MASRWLEVFYVNGRDPVKVRIGPKAEVMFERHFGISMSQAGKDISAEHLYYLAWASLRVAGQEGADFESFLDTLEDVEAVTGASLDPTRTAQESDASSS